MGEIEIMLSLVSDMGDIAADLSTRRGRVSGTEAATAGRMVVSGVVPLAELDDYSSKLKSMTAGEGSYEIEFSHYDPVPGNLQQDMAKKFQEGQSSDSD